mmetsp:Transcript_39494/g.77703  ORF Transcript_39494/g.77703 Transcript_39494/m.77703 type:complete len:114 (-) Transcript_39494:196-537(-)
MLPAVQSLDAHRSGTYPLPPLLPLSQVSVVYTDGASRSNGTPHAKAGYGIYWGPGHPCNLSCRLRGKQTNNRAKLSAIIAALETGILHGPPRTLIVKSDSWYACRALESWVPR